MLTKRRSNIEWQEVNSHKFQHKDKPYSELQQPEERGEVGKG